MAARSSGVRPMSRVCVLFFFFQAEDGIRDLTVTGVQTCALPISRALISRPALLVADEPVSMIDASLRASIVNLLRDLCRRQGVSIIYITHDLARSEERRVGKECRSRWSPYH